MGAETPILILTAAGIGFLHTLLGPDHYIPFAAMSKARGWGLSKTLRITLLCGLGHIAGSVILGLLGIALGISIKTLTGLESTRGAVAAWTLSGFGLLYGLWGLRHAARAIPHSLSGQKCCAGATTKRTVARESVTPWALFVIFVLGPCEPLIPVLIYPAIRKSYASVIPVTAAFAAATLLTMTVMVTLLYKGLHLFRLKSGGRYIHAAAGFSILFCGMSITLLGL